MKIYLLMCVLGLLCGLAWNSIKGPITVNAPEDLVRNIIVHSSNSVPSTEDGYLDLLKQAALAEGADLNRTLSAIESLYELEPAAFWRILEEKASDKERLQVVLALAVRRDGSGAIMAMEFLERGLLTGNEDETNLNRILGRAADEHADRYISWLKTGASDNRSAYILNPTNAAALRGLLPTQRKELARLMVDTATRDPSAVFSDTLALLMLGLDSLESSERSPLALRLLAAEISLPGESLPDYRARVIALLSPRAALDALASWQSAGTLSSSQAALLVESAGRDVALAPQIAALQLDLPQAVTDAIDRHLFVTRVRESLPQGDLTPLLHTRELQKLRDQDYPALAEVLLSESTDVSTVFHALSGGSIPGGEALVTAMTANWARTDVVAASAMLAQLSAVPDTAIVALINQIGQDSEAALAWAQAIQDSLLRKQMVDTVLNHR